MNPLLTITATACPLPLESVDTDQIIPARFMTRTRAEGYGGVLFNDLRFKSDGAPIADFPLNKPEYSGAQIVITRRNFGCGSSREAAAYALADFGIRCVIAPSFGDIFASNSVNNGLLPARVSEEDAEILLEATERLRLPVTIDLESCTITAGNNRIAFSIPPVWRTKLLNGWDDLDLTLSFADKIGSFAEEDRNVRPWMKPVSQPQG